MPRKPDRLSGAVVMQFARWPVPGQVKTRLAATLGKAGALDAHLRLTGFVMDNLLNAAPALEIWWDREPALSPPAAAVPLLTRLRENRVIQRTQEGSDLGERMGRALSAGLDSYRKAVIVGSDCPGVDGGYLAAALAALDSRDVVLGPADDGGYVLIGARRTLPDMLVNVEWGTGRALEQTCRNLKRLGLTWTSLPLSWDVDEPGDWERFLSMAGRKRQ